MVMTVVRYPLKTNQLLMKIHKQVYAVEYPQTLRAKNLKNIAIATVIARCTPQNLISSKSSWGQHILKIW